MCLHRCHFILLRLSESFNQHIDLERVFSGQFVDLREYIIGFSLQINSGCLTIDPSTDYIRLQNIHEPDLSLLQIFLLSHCAYFFDRNAVIHSAINQYYFTFQRVLQRGTHSFQNRVLSTHFWDLFMQHLKGFFKVKFIKDQIYNSEERVISEDFLVILQNRKHCAIA